MDAKLTTLHTIIKHSVFISKEKRRIISPLGGEPDWIFDFRAVLLDAKFLDAFTEVVWEKIESYYPFQIGGQETAAIPLITALVLKSKAKGKAVSGFYMRKSRKTYDLQNNIEGTVTQDPVILIDDIINWGSTMQKQILLLEKEGLHLAAIVVLLRFCETQAYSGITEKNVPFISLFSLPDFGISIQKPSPREAPQTQVYKTLWYGKSPNPTFSYIVPKSAPLLDEVRLYFGTDNSNFVALHQRDGTEAWSFKVGKPVAGKSIFSSPALWKDVIYFGSYDGNFYALRKDDGSLVWAYKEADWIGSSPAVAPELHMLFVGLEFGLFKKRGGIVALDLSTGEKRWDYRIPGLVHSSPGYSSRYRAVGVGSNNNTFYLFDAHSGALRWQFEAGDAIKYSCVFDEARGLVFFGSLDGTLYGLDIDSGAVRFSFKTGDGIYSNPLLSKNTVYVGSLDKTLYAVDIDSQTVLWKKLLGGRILSSAAFIEGAVVVGCNNGRMYELDSTTGVILSYFQTTERIVNKIAYNPKTKRYFVPTFANEIYCLEKHVEKPLTEVVSYQK